MMRWRWLLIVLAFGVPWLGASGAGIRSRIKLNRVNMKLHGQVIDFTANHGADHRIWSPALNQCRDMYVYLPPGYDPNKRYPLGIFLHGATQDEQFFLENPVKLFDDAIANHELPPVIVVAPDGSIQGKPSFLRSASFFANTRAGNFEDWIMTDMWNFVMENFPIRPEREAHAIMGVSMGGSAAFAHGIKHRDKVKIVVGFVPAVNLRWVDCHGKYNSHFDPQCWGFREEACPLEVIGRPKLGLVKVRFCTLFTPIVGKGPAVAENLSQINPLEILMRSDLKEGDLSMYIGYTGRDEFNIAAHVESFLHVAKERNLHIDVEYDPLGKHNTAAGVKLFPGAIRWVAPLVAPYAQEDEALPAPKMKSEEKPD